jgi:hypothetical protein
MSKELIIDENNFSDYFKDVSVKNKPDKGEIMACYVTKAKFGAGDLKSDVIHSMKENVFSTIKILQKIAKARYLDSLIILKQMLSDKLSGLSDKEIEDKEYEYTAEFFYYTKKEYVPTDDPRWSTLKIHDVDELLCKEKNTLLKSKIIENV